MSAKTAVARPRNTARFLNIEEFIAQRLRHRRIMLGLTQEQFAELIGVSPRQAKKYEAGTSRISAARLYHIARALGVEVSYFFEAADQDQPPTTHELLPAQRMLLELARSFASMELEDQEIVSSLARSLRSSGGSFVTGRNLQQLLSFWDIDLDSLRTMLGFEHLFQLRLFLTGEPLVITRDSMDRATSLLQIHECIVKLAPSVAEQRKMLRMPHKELANRSILSLLLDASMESVVQARHFITQLRNDQQTNDVPAEFTGHIYIGRGTLKHAQNLSEKVVNLLNSTGYGVERDDYVSGSWTQRVVARMKKSLHSHQVKENATIVGDVLCGVVSADADVKILGCVADLTAAFADVDDVVVDAGPFLFVKVSSARKRKSIFVKRLTVEDRVIINGNPHLLRKPSEILLRLKSFKAITMKEHQEGADKELPQIPFVADSRD